MMVIQNPWKKLLCPFCFERFRLADAWYRCRNPNVTECPEEIDQAYSDHTGVANRFMRKAFAPLQPRGFGFNQPAASCPQCNKQTTMRICPHCRSKLPTQTDHVDSKILAVIGGTSSGKSHYIATMVQQLQSVLGPNMKIKVMGVGDTTRTNYRDYYYERVYRDKLVLDQTQSAQNNPVVRDPLIYRLEFPRQRLRIRAINLVLFDAAGEDIQDENTLGLYNKYILHAAGIIFLINPLQILSVCEQLGISPDTGEIVQHTLERVVELYFTAHGFKPGHQIKVPTAFVLSKSDVLEPIVDKQSAFLQELPHIGHYDLRDFEMIHEEMKSYLSSWGADGLLSLAESFNPHGFFAISALGSHPKNLTIPQINPRRAGDPILWLLTQLGYLKPYRSP